jgi:hypothetical protein
VFVQKIIGGCSNFDNFSKLLSLTLLNDGSFWILLLLRYPEYCYRIALFSCTAYYILVTIFYGQINNQSFLGIEMTLKNGLSSDVGLSSVSCSVLSYLTNSLSMWLQSFWCVFNALPYMYHSDILVAVLWLDFLVCESS